MTSNLIDEIKILDATRSNPKYKRPQLEPIYFNAEESKLIATDGRRMVMVDTSNISDFPQLKQGCYLPAKVGKSLTLIESESNSYVNYKLAIPNTSGHSEFTISSCDVATCFYRDKKTAIAEKILFELAANFKTRLRLQYIIDAISGKETSFRIFARPPEKYPFPVVIEADGRTAIIMPIQEAKK